MPNRVGRPPAAPRVPEAAVQQQIVRLARMVRGEVWELGTKRSRRDYHMGTRQTPGVPDLLIFLPPVPPAVHWLFVFLEAKAQGGRLRPEQARFRDLATLAQQHHIVGGLDAFIAFLLQHGYLTRDQVPHYRLPELVK